MIRAVLDANVLASGLVGITKNSQAAPASIMREWVLGRFVLVVSEEILSKVENSAFTRPYFQRSWTENAKSRAVSRVRKYAEFTLLSHSVSGVAPDPDDDHVLSAALSSGATYIVTGDRRLRSVDTYAGVKLITPQEFLQILETSAQSD